MSVAPFIFKMEDRKMGLWLMIGFIIVLFFIWVFVNAYIRFKFTIDTVGEQLALDYKNKQKKEK